MKEFYTVREFIEYVKNRWSNEKLDAYGKYYKHLRSKVNSAILKLNQEFKNPPAECLEKLESFKVFNRQKFTEWMFANVTVDPKVSTLTVLGLIFDIGITVRNGRFYVEELND